MMMRSTRRSAGPADNRRIRGRITCRSANPGLDPCVLFRFTCAALAAAPVLADAQQAGSNRRARPRGDRRNSQPARRTPAGRRHFCHRAWLGVAQQPEHHDGDRHHPRRAQSQDERVFVLPGGLQHPRRGAEQLRRRAGAAGRRLPGRQLLELDQPRELPGVRPRARRDAARPAGHAVRPQRDGRRDPVHLAQAQRRVRGLRRGDLRTLQPADLRRRAVRAVLRQMAGTHCVHQQPGRRLHQRTRSQARRIAAPTTITRCAGGSPGSRRRTRTST